MLTHPAMGKTLRARALRGPHHVLQPRPRVQLVYGPRVRVPRGLSRRHGRRRWWLRMQLIYWLKVACGAFSGVKRGDPVSGGHSAAALSAELAAAILLAAACAVRAKKRGFRPRTSSAGPSCWLC